MLTGDKMETAENIAISCKLFISEMQRIYITKKSIHDLLLLQDNHSGYKVPTGLLVDGESLGIILNDSSLI